MKPRILQHEVRGNGDPIVLVPGGLTGWISWVPHAERLAATRTVVRVQPVHNELAEHGEIPGPGYGPEIERECLRLTLDGLGIDRADFAGWSNGARALIEFSLEYPGRIRTLTLVEPPAGWVLERAGRGGVPEEAAFASRVAGRSVTEEELAEFLHLAGITGVGENPRQNPNWPVWSKFRNALASDYVLTKSSRTLDELRGFSRPVLLVVGTETAQFLKDIIDELSSNYPDARLLALPGGHRCHIENIDRFLAELESFTSDAEVPG